MNSHPDLPAAEKQLDGIIKSELSINQSVMNSSINSCGAITAVPISRRKNRKVAYGPYHLTRIITNLYVLGHDLKLEAKKLLPRPIICNW